MAKKKVTKTCEDCGATAKSNRARYCKKCGEARRQGKVRKPRETTIVTNELRCPHCGEDTAIVLEHSYFGGRKRYRCWSETCKAHGKVKGRGRPFLIMADGTRPGRNTVANNPV